MQPSYVYFISEPEGDNFNPNFKPYLRPQEMPEMRVFEEKYCNDCPDELPTAWHENPKISDLPDPKMNYFSFKSRQSLDIWREKGWIVGPDPR